MAEIALLLHLILFFQNLRDVFSFDRARSFSRIRSTNFVSIQMTKNDNPSSRTDEEVRDLLRDAREVSSETTPQSLRDFAELDKELMKSLKSKRSYFSLVAEQIMQSIDDFQLSTKTKEIHKVVEVDPLGSEKLKQRPRPRLVVLGTGWGAYSFLKSIGNTSLSKLQSLVSI